MKQLTPKQESFCNYYIETGNASEAYRRAYSCDRMKAETIKVKASQMLDKDNIRITIEQFQNALQERSDITKDEAIKELTNIVRARVTDVLFVKGTTIRIKDLDELPDHVVSCISVMKKVKGGVEVKLYDKIAAIDRLSKMLGWDKATKLDVQGSVPVKEWLIQFESMDKDELDQ